MKYYLTLLFLILFALSGCISPEMRTAKIAINERDYFRAIENLDRELARIPGNANVWFLKGYAYEKLSDWQNMSMSYDSSLALSDEFMSEIEQSISKLVSRYYRKSVMLFDSSLWDSALFYLDTAIIIDKSNFRLYRQAAITTYRGDKYDQAIEFCMAAIDIEPTIFAARDEASNNEKIAEPDFNMESRNVLLAIYHEQKDTNNVVEWSLNIMNRVEAIDGDPNDYLSSLDKLIEAYDAMEENVLAESAIMKAIEKFPDNIQLKLNLATYKSRSEDYQGAVKIFEEVLLSDPNNVYANLTIGTVLIMEKKYEESIPYLEAVIAEEPDNLSALQNLVSAYYNTEQIDKGSEVRKRWESLK